MQLPTVGVTISIRHALGAFVLLVLSCAAANAQPATPAGGYAGSAACKQCHESQYDRWQKTRMANLIVDAKKHPEAEDRAQDRRLLRAQPYVPLHPAVGNGALQGSESVHDVPSRSNDRERDRDDPEVARRVAVAGDAMSSRKE
jgi:hypothetical protein